MGSAKISDSAVQDVSASMLVSLENEDDEFLDEFNRVIKDSDLAEADDPITSYSAKWTGSARD